MLLTMPLLIFVIRGSQVQILQPAPMKSMVSRCSIRCIEGSNPEMQPPYNHQASPPANPTSVGRKTNLLNGASLLEVHYHCAKPDKHGCSYVIRVVSTQGAGGTATGVGGGGARGAPDREELTLESC